MQSVNKFVSDAPQLARLLRWIAWAELGAILLFSIINFCSVYSVVGYYGGSLSAISSFLIAVLQAAAIWGVLMGVALLLDNQAKSRSDK